MGFCLRTGFQTPRNSKKLRVNETTEFETANKQDHFVLQHILWRYENHCRIISGRLAVAKPYYDHPFCDFCHNRRDFA